MRRLLFYAGALSATFLVGYLRARINPLSIKSRINPSPIKLMPPPLAQAAQQSPIPPPLPPPPPVQQAAPREDTSPCHDEAIITWDAREEGAMLEARFEGLRQPFPDDLWDQKKYPYWSRLTIKNLRTKRVIYEERFESSLFVSMYTRDLNGDSHVELILTTTPGAVCEQMSIFSVTPSGVKLLLYKPHRLLGDAEFVKGENGLTDVVITDAELGTGPYYTTRYVWQGRRFKPVATVPVEEFIRNRQSLLQRQKRRSKRGVGFHH
jgi:hypothetical protein